MNALPVDKIKPWSIKSIPVATSDKIKKAAMREGLTVGQWLERRIKEWEDDGRPVSAAPVNLGELAVLLQAIAAAQTAGVRGAKTAASHAVAVISDQLRKTRGLPALAHRSPPKKARQPKISTENDRSVLSAPLNSADIPAQN